MKSFLFSCFLLLLTSCTQAQNNSVNHTQIQEDLQEIITDLQYNYAYLADKNVDLTCLQKEYKSRIEDIKTEEETILFFEYLLDEFYDTHLILNTNRSASFRLSAPVYTSFKNGKAIITQVWQTQLTNLNENILGAEIKKINGQDINKEIDNFPTYCNDKNDDKVREWIANKLLAGRYNEPRVVTIALANNTTFELDIDSLQLKKDADLLTTTMTDNIGIIRVNNSLGRDALVTAFDTALDAFSNTDGLIIDLRNTIDGGDSYEARGIMSRFVSEPKPYQRHTYMATSANNPDVERNWVEYVSPRGTTYKKPVIVLVGRWTGSMGEGLAIGFEGIERAEIVGTEMERLAGEMNGFSFKHQSFGYRLSTARLFHINGTPREQYIPTHYVKQTTLARDEILEKGIALLLKK